MLKKYKVGCSKDTPQKLDDFEYLMRRLLAITANVVKGTPFARQEIIVVDWNAGPGRYPGPAREILECTALHTARLAQRSEVPVHLMAVEGNEDSANSLELELQQWHSPKFTFRILRDDNSAVVGDVESYLKPGREHHRAYGVQIFDPNGRPQETVLSQIQYHSLVADLDVLAHYSTAFIKWFRSVGKTRAGTRLLSEYLYELHNKQQWSIQKPRGGHRQAGWFLGSDWKGLVGTMRRLDMFDINSKEGQAQFDELERTKKERGIGKESDGEEGDDDAQLSLFDESE